MIDCHSHIIPGIDDGSQDVETTLSMLKLAEATGTKKIILTPHYYRGKYMIPFYELEKKKLEVEKLMQENNINIDLFIGQEVFFTRYLLDYLDNKEIGTINNSRYMLIELSPIEYNKEEVLETLYNLKMRGKVPIIAHPERYRYFQKEPFTINDFIDTGCLFQLNAASIGGSFGSQVKKLANLYLENGIYSVIGSDAHGKERRTTDINKYIVDIEEVKKGFINQATLNAEAILKNDEISCNGKKIEKKKKSIFSNIFGR